MKDFSFKKILIAFFIGLYFVLSTASSCNAAICFSEDHIGVNAFGMSSCCDKVQDSKTKTSATNTDNCIDKKLSLDATYSAYQKAPLGENNAILDTFYAILPTLNLLSYEQKYSQIYQSKDIKPPNNTMVALSSIILLI